jgi:hypothetical protein
MFDRSRRIDSQCGSASGEGFEDYPVGPVSLPGEATDTGPADGTPESGTSADPHPRSVRRGPAASPGIDSPVAADGRDDRRER